VVGNEADVGLAHGPKRLSVFQESTEYDRVWGKALVGHLLLEDASITPIANHS